jgi:hypothetical protein
MRPWRRSATSAPPKTCLTGRGCGGTLLPARFQARRVGTRAAAPGFGHLVVFPEDRGDGLQSPDVMNRLRVADSASRVCWPVDDFHRPGSTLRLRFGRCPPAIGWLATVRTPDPAECSLYGVWLACARFRKRSVPTNARTRAGGPSGQVSLSWAGLRSAWRKRPNTQPPRDPRMQGCPCVRRCMRTDQLTRRYPRGG